MKSKLGILAFLMLAACSVQAADYRLPFDGTWFVMHGGDTVNVNHHMSDRSQWYGNDFVKVGGLAGRSLSKGVGKSLEDYYSWEESVLAPVAGIVDAVHDGEDDNPVGTKDRSKPFGNYVRIRVGTEEFVYLAHLKKGSVVVERGETVMMGQLLGRCGNSGHSDYPHIHMHVQTEREPFSGEGRNITFQGIGVQLSGKRFVNVDWPLIRGLFVRKTAVSNGTKRDNSTWRAGRNQTAFASHNSGVPQHLAILWGGRYLTQRRGVRGRESRRRVVF